MNQREVAAAKRKAEAGNLVEEDGKPVSRVDQIIFEKVIRLYLRL